MEESNALVAVTDLPAFVTAMGKGALTETLPSYGGYYAGAASFPEIRQYVESSDALLFIGRYPVCMLFRVEFEVSTLTLC